MNGASLIIASGSPVAVAVTKAPPVSIEKIEGSEALPPAGSITKLSTLSCQLSESAARAEARESSMSRRELGEYAKKINKRLLHVLDDVSKVTQNRKKPDTNDPELMARDNQATEFLIKKWSGDSTGKNPFNGLSREQLTIILYDEDGPFTDNERRAAWSATQDMDQQWSGKVFANVWLEGASGGKTPKYFTELLAHYRSLPLIEQVQLPEDYEAQLQAWLDDALSGEEKPEEDDFLNLVQILAKERKPEKKDKEADKTEAELEPKTNNLSLDASPTSPTTPRS